MDRADMRRRSKEDEKLLTRGLDPEVQSPEPSAAMARQLYALVETAKRTGVIDPVVTYLTGKLDATVRGLRDVPVACRKGCAHCCHIWVSATAPELLFVAKVVRRRGAALMERVRAVHLATKDFEFIERGRHPTACPMLVDNVCSIYESRPGSCRMAVSLDTQVCARAYGQGANEDVPTPVLYLRGRSYYAMALASALRRAELPIHGYEFNAGLVRALDYPDAERAWLSGVDVFEGVRRDPAEIFRGQHAQRLFEHAFKD